MPRGPFANVAEYYALVGPQMPLTVDARSLLPQPTENYVVFDVGIMFPTKGEKLPSGYACLPFDLNAGRGTFSVPTYLCFLKGRHDGASDTELAPIVDIRVQYQTETVPPGYIKIEKSTGGLPARLHGGLGVKSKFLFVLRQHRRRQVLTEEGFASPHLPPLVDIRMRATSRGRQTEGVCPPGYRAANKPLKDGKSWGEGGERIDLLLKHREESGTIGDVPYRAMTLDRYPRVDRDSLAFPCQFPDFCFSRGVRLVHSKRGFAGVPGPHFFSWSLNDDLLGTMFVTSLVFYEAVEGDLPTEASLAVNTSTDSLFVPKIMSIVSRHCFFSGFQEFLTQLYRVSMSRSSLPIEDYVVHFFECVPLPSLNSTRVLVTYDGIRRNSTIAPFARNFLNIFEVTDFDFEVLFSCLDVENVINVFALLLLEQKIVVHSRHLCILTPMIHALLSLIFPTKWAGQYIPLCPTAIAEVLGMPMPFLVGMHTADVRNAPEVPADVYMVDLDCNEVFASETPMVTGANALPGPLVNALRARLSAIVAAAHIGVTPGISRDWSMSEYAFHLAAPPSSIDIGKHTVPIESEAVLDATLRFMAIFLSKTSRFLRSEPKNAEPRTLDDSGETFYELIDLFGTEYFIAAFPDEMGAFLRRYCETQSFARFVFAVNQYFGTIECINYEAINQDSNEAELMKHQHLFFSLATNYCSVTSLAEIHKRDSRVDPKDGPDQSRHVQNASLSNEAVYIDGPKEGSLRVALLGAMEGCNMCEDDIGEVTHTEHTTEHTLTVEGPSVTSERMKALLTCPEPDTRKRGNSNTNFENFPILSTAKLSNAISFYQEQHRERAPKGFVRHLRRVQSIPSGDEVEHEMLV